MKKFTSFSTKNYHPISTGSRYLHDDYERIKNFIKENFQQKELFADILAMPIHEGTAVSWYCNYDTQFKRLNEFDETTQNSIKEKYWELLERVKYKIKELKTSIDKNQNSWSDILKMTFDEDNNVLFSDGNNLVLLWGWSFKNKSENFIPASFFQSIQQKVKTDIETKSVVTENIVKPDEPIKETVPEINNLADDIDKEEIPDIEDFEEVDAIENLNKENNIPWWKKLWSAIVLFFKEYWMLIVFLILFILLLQFLRGCDYSFLPWNDDDSKNSKTIVTPPKKSVYLPKKPNKLMPIPPDKIIKDPDGYTDIVSDRLNIFIKDKDITISQFADDFKKTFPDSSYKILSYHEDISLLQIQFPENKVSTIKDELKNKMNKYKLLMWSEAIYSSNKVFNDSYFTKNEYNWYFKAIKCFQGWEYTTGSDSVIIAVIDGNFDLNHRELKESKIYKPFNINKWNSDVTLLGKTMHGSHVSGTIIAKNNNSFGLSGIAPACRYMPIEASDGNTRFPLSNIVYALLYARNNKADVVNLSIGLGAPENLRKSNPNYDKFLNRMNGFEEFMTELLKMMDEENITVVFAGGNENNPIQFDPQKRNKYSINVCAINEDIKKARFSNYSLDTNIFTIAAPGVNILSCTKNNEFFNGKGTSMAAPIVSGTIALMKSIKPNLTNQQIRDILNKTGQDLGDPKIGKMIRVDNIMKYLKFSM